VKLGGKIDSVIPAQVIVLWPEAPLVGGVVSVDEGLEPFLTCRVLHIAEVRAVDIFNGIAGTVFNRHGKHRLGFIQGNFQLQADIELPAALGVHSVPGKGSRAAIRRCLYRGERLFFAKHRVVTQLFRERDQQAKREAQLRAVEDFPAGFHCCKTGERAGQGRKFHAQVGILEKNGIHGKGPKVNAKE